jgi:hypothetical protein
LSHGFAKGLNSKQFFYEYYDTVCIPCLPTLGALASRIYGKIFSLVLYAHPLPMRHSFSTLFRLTTPLAIAGLVALNLPLQPAVARKDKDDNGYQACAAALRDSGIADAQVAAACAAALRPVDLATCVGAIGGGTAIAAPDALSGCRRVRRPVDFATCVIDISQGEGAAANEVLDHCRRSLLPARFSECVVGLVAEISATTGSAMKSCIAATDPMPDGLPAASDQSQPMIPEPMPTPEAVPSPPPTPSPAPKP